jgi:hypothetical protein
VFVGAWCFHEFLYSLRRSRADTVSLCEKQVRELLFVLSAVKENRMKKPIFFLVSAILLAVLLAFTTTPAFGAGLALESVTARTPGRLVLTFAGNPGSAREISGTASVEGKTFSVDCTIGDHDRLVCHIEGGIYRYAGQLVLVVIEGQRFLVTIPARPVRHNNSGPVTPWWCDDFPQDENCAQ